jgi:mannose-6-phosphate isomerase-like protein (cupin superfamily)
MERIVGWEELGGSSPTSYVFTGEGHEATVCILVADLPPGDGPRLHRHPYEEVFVLHEGRARFTVDGRAVEAGVGQVVVVPAGVPHKFVNAGEGRLRITSVQPSPQRIGEWLED